MDLSWVATPYGMGAVGAVCILLGFAINKGISWDRDDRVLKIGSKRHPKTLDRFNELFNGVAEMKNSFEKLRLESEDLRMHALKTIITNERLPAVQRAEAFDEYTARGGNGWVRVYYEQNVKPLLIEGVRNEN